MAFLSMKEVHKRAVKRMSVEDILKEAPKDCLIDYDSRASKSIGEGSGAFLQTRRRAQSARPLISALFGGPTWQMK